MKYVSVGMVMLMASMALGSQEMNHGAVLAETRALHDNALEQLQLKRALPVRDASRFIKEQVDVFEGLQKSYSKELDNLEDIQEKLIKDGKNRTVRARQVNRNIVYMRSALKVIDALINRYNEARKGLVVRKVAVRRRVQPQKRAVVSAAKSRQGGCPTGRCPRRATQQRRAVTPRVRKIASPRRAVGGCPTGNCPRRS